VRFTYTYLCTSQHAPGFPPSPPCPGTPLPFLSGNPRPCGDAPRKNVNRSIPSQARRHPLWTLDYAPSHVKLAPSERGGTNAANIDVQRHFRTLNLPTIAKVSGTAPPCDPLTPPSRFHRVLVQAMWSLECARSTPATRTDRNVRNSVTSRPRTCVLENDGRTRRPLSHALSATILLHSHII
jgi:hypothetical protein